jgi:hypothetical protein
LTTAVTLNTVVWEWTVKWTNYRSVPKIGPMQFYVTCFLMLGANNEMKFEFKSFNVKMVYSAEAIDNLFSWQNQGCKLGSVKKNRFFYKSFVNSRSQTVAIYSLVQIVKMKL